MLLRFILRWLALVAAIGLSFASAATQSCDSPQVCNILPGVPYRVPYGERIPLDGSIGSEWDDALRKPTSIWCDGKRLITQLYLMHDKSELFLGISISTKKRYSGTLRVIALFDNGDDIPWSPGDNAVIMSETSGTSLTSEIDHHYSRLGKAVVDDIQNARGSGRWNPSSRAYEFEIAMEMDSGDSQDLVLEPGKPLTMKVAFEVLDQRKNIAHAGKTPPILIALENPPANADASCPD